MRRHMPSAAFSFKTRQELKQMSLLEINVYIAELRRRAAWLLGPAARKDLDEQLELAVKARDAKREGK
jgi:hypothetical protein